MACATTQHRPPGATLAYIYGAPQQSGHIGDQERATTEILACTPKSDKSYKAHQTSPTVTSLTSPETSRMSTYRTRRQWTAALTVVSLLLAAASFIAAFAIALR